MSWILEELQRSQVVLLVSKLKEEGFYLYLTFFTLLDGAKCLFPHMM